MVKDAALLITAVIDMNKVIVNMVRAGMYMSICPVKYKTIPKTQ